MIWPKLVPKWVMQTPIKIVIEAEGLDEDGAPLEAFSADLMCNWQDGGKVELTTEQKYVRISGKAFFDGDICPEIPNIVSGYAIAAGAKREIAEGIKSRNPDGTVNYTEVRFL